MEVRSGNSCWRVVWHCCPAASGLTSSRISPCPLSGRSMIISTSCWIRLCSHSHSCCEYFERRQTFHFMKRRASLGSTRVRDQGYGPNCRGPGRPCWSWSSLSSIHVFPILAVVYGGKHAIWFGAERTPTTLLVCCLYRSPKSNFSGLESRSGYQSRRGSSTGGTA